MNTTWKRINPGTDPRSRGYGEEPDLALVRRSYGQDGNKWPRLIIAIYPVYSLEVPFEERLKKPPIGFEIDAIFKYALNDSWEEGVNSHAFIPIELYSELLEMLEEAKKIIESREK